MGELSKANRPFPKGSEPPWPHSNRGWHGVPASYHRWWVENRGQYVIETMKKMRCSFWLLITDGDSAMEMCDTHQGRMTVLDLFLSNEICPVIRDTTDPLFLSYRNINNVRKFVEIYDRYGMRPMIQLANEPFDDRENQGDPLDPYEDESWEILGDWWNHAATMVVEAGGNPGFPDGPCFPRNPFPYLDRRIFDAGYGWYAAHPYMKNRPINYAEDVVSRTGYEHYENGERQLLTWDEYREQLDVYGDPDHPEHRQWVDVSLDDINKQRMEQKNPNPYPPDHPDFDATCWRAHEQIAAWSQDTFGYTIPIALCEGGSQPRDRAGSGEYIDIRWPLTTPGMVAKKTLQMFQEPTNTMFAQMPWLFADDYLCVAGFVGWPFDAAVIGWAFMNDYGYEKPIVDLLANNPPAKDCPWANVRRSFEAILTA